MYVCICNQVTETDVRRAVSVHGRDDQHRLAERLGLVSDRCCGRCAQQMDRVLACVADSVEAQAVA